MTPESQLQCIQRDIVYFKKSIPRQKKKLFTIDKNTALMDAHEFLHFEKFSYV